MGYRATYPETLLHCPHSQEHSRSLHPTPLQDSHRSTVTRRPSARCFPEAPLVSRHNLPPEAVPQNIQEKQGEQPGQGPRRWTEIGRARATRKRNSTPQYGWEQGSKALRGQTSWWHVKEVAHLAQMVSRLHQTCLATQYYQPLPTPHLPRPTYITRSVTLLFWFHSCLVSV